MPPDAADQWELGHDPDYRCTRCGHQKPPQHRYCGRCTRRIVKKAMRLLAQRRLIMVVPSRLADLIAQDSIPFDTHTDPAAMDADCMPFKAWAGVWAVQNEIPVIGGNR